MRLSALLFGSLSLLSIARADDPLIVDPQPSPSPPVIVPSTPLPRIEHAFTRPKRIDDWEDRHGPSMEVGFVTGIGTTFWEQGPKPVKTYATGWGGGTRRSVFTRTFTTEKTTNGCGTATACDGA